MKAKREYLVYRHGSNAANQPLTECVPVAIVLADTKDAATATTWGGANPSVHSAPWIAATILAAADECLVYANQYLSATPRSKARQSDLRSVLEASAMRNL